MKVLLDFKSPLLIGSKKHSSNFIESDDVLKGSVVRAAFAKVILDNCCERNEADVKEVNGEKKMNWVYFRDKAGCLQCCFNNICKEFSNVRFSYFYPKGTEIIPQTSMVCKTDKNHGFIDLLVDDTSKGCTKCEGGSRVEFTSGLRTTDENKKPYSVIKSFTTKNKINPYSKTSADGMLYSIETVSCTPIKEDSDNEDESKLLFEGSIEGISENDLILFKRVRVGGDITTGLGKCVVSKLDSLKNEIEFKQIEKFSIDYKARNKNKGFIDKESNYISIKFIGDCILNFDFDGDVYLDTDELKKLWRKPLELEEDIKIEKIYTEVINYRGYDNSSISEDKREEAMTLISKGTVMVFSSKKSLRDLYSYFQVKQKCGFGLENENGFGDFEIYLGR
ncbi:hypothetical protein [Clostridium diolis]|uniref:CRISPR-associated protein Csx10 n=1 Tax=Clostridium diolis TaxID=223919 RepID=A0AAV3VZ00_9CLOT|nr:hypothetical protein [Clostridium diolis]QES74237.1 hypothetical protein F3K33_16005 [Clostridium diolis]GEA30795.1 hypothetical protein CDIOL_17180 [Clostridium diolis]